jgi:prepilin-type N-terminal cleavage/methylation domain-containing protein
MISKLKKDNTIQLNSGFNLIEVTAAMVIMATCLAYAMPVVLYSKVVTSKSEERAGALIVSQKIFDDIRGKTFGNIPTVDTTVTNTTTTNGTFPPLLIDQVKGAGRNYNVAVRYCETGTVDSPTNQCTDSYRQFKITVRSPNGSQTSDSSIVYETQAAFTNFN